MLEILLTTLKFKQAYIILCSLKYSSECSDVFSLPEYVLNDDLYAFQILLRLFDCSKLRSLILFLILANFTHMYRVEEIKIIRITITHIAVNILSANASPQKGNNLFKKFIEIWYWLYYIQ